MDKSSAYLALLANIISNNNNADFILDLSAIVTSRDTLLTSKIKQATPPAYTAGL